MDVLKEIVEEIEWRIPGPKNFTPEAHRWFVSYVFRKVFGDTIQEAVDEAYSQLEWNNRTERYE